MGPRLKRLLISLIVGGVITGMPQMAYMLPGDSRFVDRLQQGVSLLLVPAAPISLLLSRGNIHDTSLPVILATTWGFYTLIIYAIASLRTRIKARRR